IVGHFSNMESSNAPAEHERILCSAGALLLPLRISSAVADCCSGKRHLWRSGTGGNLRDRLRRDRGYLLFVRLLAVGASGGQQGSEQKQVDDPLQGGISLWARNC